MCNSADACILAAAWLLALSTSWAAILPYGPSQHDAPFSSRADDACDAIATRQMPFLGTLSSVLYVCTNGLVSFDEPLNGYVPSDISLDGRNKIVAPFWSDVDLRLGGDLLHRVSFKMNKSSELDQLDVISREVRQLKMVEFYGSWFVVVTWLNVCGFGAPAVDGQGTNTFQLVLVTDGNSTYAIFNYEQISWDRTISSPRRAQAGASGAVNNLYILVNDGKNLTDLARNSNVGIPGKWIYRVDFKACEELSCNNGVPTNASFSVSCECEPCYTGPCCEDRIVNCTSNCYDCVDGANCTTPRINSCKCNRCANETDSCIDVNPGKGARRCVKPPDTAASEFTLMFEDNFANSPYGLEVYVSAASDDGKSRAVTVDAPLMGYSASDVIQPGEVKKFSIDVSLKHTKTGKENFGIRVRETNKNLVNVYCINRAEFSTDAWLALPDKVAGKAYIVVSYSPIVVASQFALVAIQNNTVVNVNLVEGSEDIPGSGKNTTVVVNLNAWQTYQVKSGKSDFTGTSIVSNNAIHVYSGEARGWVGPSPLNPDYDPSFPAGSKSRDNLILECTSIDTWGKTYAVVPLPRTHIGYTYTEETARVVSYTAATCKLYATTFSVLHFTESTIVLNAAGNYYAQFYMNAAYNYFLTCDKPVMLVEITESSIPKGNSYNDPSFIYVPAVSSYSNYYHFVPPVNNDPNVPYQFTYLRLIASASDYSGIEISGEPVAAMAIETMKNWTRIYVPSGSPSTDFPNLFGCIVRISSSNSTSVIHPTSSVKFAAIVEGYDDRVSYGIALGASIKPQNSSFSVAALQSGPVVATVS